MDTKLLKESGYSIVFPIWEKIMIDTSPTEASKFMQKFIKGYCGRASVRISKPVGTTPDPMIDVIISARLPDADLKIMRSGHRLSMSAENILGIILEEYIHGKVLPHQWSCCWGNSIRAVDLCSSNGDLYQIKNRSNSENSSSSVIRSGTSIKKWHRIDARTGKTYWDDLSSIIGIRQLFSEEEFTGFCISLIKRNPDVLSII